MTYTNTYIYISFCIIVIGIIFIILFSYVSGTIKSTIENELMPSIDNGQLTYFKCAGKTLNDATLKGLQTTEFKKGASANTSSLYIPCDYNYIEIELAKLTPSNQTKYIYAIKGCDSLCGKDSLWRMLDLVYGREEASKIMPQTWIIDDEEDNGLDTYYQTHRVAQPAFILKKNIQGKRGLKIADSLDMIYEIVSYDNAYKVAQLYIKNCYTINDRKLNIRLYVVISCFRKQIQWFIYNYGKCIYTNKKYDPVQSFIGNNINDKEQHFTSYNLNTKQVYITEKLPETLQDLALFIDANQYAKLWAQICAKLSAIKKAFSGSLCNLESLAEQICFQLFGIDIIIDADTVCTGLQAQCNATGVTHNSRSRLSPRGEMGLEFSVSGTMEPYVLEFNKGPEMTYKSPGDNTLKPQLITDMLNMITNKVGVTESNFTVID